MQGIKLSLVSERGISVKALVTQKLMKQREFGYFMIEVIGNN